MLARTAPPSLNLLAINVTRRCNLACAHCYLDADTLRQKDINEITEERMCNLLDDVATHHPSAMVVLTGGEPLVRKDLENVIAHGNQLGLFMLLGSNGMLLTPARVGSLKAAGLQGVGISLDSLDEASHDQFRGQVGAWRKTVKAIEECRKQGLSFQIHFSIHQGNMHELEDMIDYAAMLEARVMNIFFLVCTGRGQAVADLTPEQYDRQLETILKAQERYPGMVIRPRCAPHAKRLAYQLDPHSIVNQISGNDGDGCIAGRHYCRITSHGGVTACPYIEQEVGNIHTQPLSEIWHQADQFNQLRQPQLQGKCGVCEYRELCGGCRARPVAQGLDLMASDSLCAHQPSEQDVIQPIQLNAHTIIWSDAAQQRLSRAPAFVRAMIKKRVEAEVLQRGESLVHTEHLAQLVERRFGKSSPKPKNLV